VNREKLKKFLIKGSEITGGAIGGAIGLIGGPAGAIAGGGLGVLTAQLTNEIIERSLSDRQKVRIAATSTFLFEGVAERLENGEKIRNDNFFDRKIYDRSEAEELFEGTLLKCCNEFQERKIPFISKIFEKTIFSESISAETANQLLTIADSLSYRKLCILSFYGRRESDFSEEIIMRDTYYWYPNIVFTVDEKLLLQDVFELINLDLLDKKNHMLVSNRDITPDKLSLSEIGKSLYEIMELSNLKSEDIHPIIEGLKYKPEWGISTNNTINGERQV